MDAFRWMWMHPGRTNISIPRTIRFIRAPSGCWCRVCKAPGWFNLWDMGLLFASDIVRYLLDGGELPVLELEDRSGLEVIQVDFADAVEHHSEIETLTTCL